MVSESFFAEIIREKHCSFLGQIAVSDEEYANLIELARIRVRFLQNRSIVPADLCLSVAMVQIAIRHYREGRYWPCFLDAIGIDLPASRLNYLGQIFAKTISNYHLFSIPQEERETNQYVENIKAHAFVTDWYLNGYFDFSYAFFENNLFRELPTDIGEDLEDLSSFMRTTLNNKKDAISAGGDPKKASKSYKLLHSTRAAFSYGERAALRSFFFQTLQNIDRYYYDGILPNVQGDRFEKGFASWIKERQKSELSGEEKRINSRRITNRRPFLRVDSKHETAFLVIPQQKFRNEDCSGAATVIIEICGQTHTRDLSLYRSFGIYISERLEIGIPDVFDDIRITISSLADREYRILNANYRVFNSSWESIQKPVEGHNYLLVKKNIPVSVNREEDIVEFSDDYASWQYLSINVSEESVFQIGIKPLSIVGEFTLDPVFEHLVNRFQVRSKLGQTLITTRAHPEVSFLADKNRVHGTSLLVNEKRYPIERITEKSTFEWPQDKNLMAVTVYLESVLPHCDGEYKIMLDIPAQEKKLLCKYLLLRDFQCLFDKRKYTYDKEILLEVRRGGHTVSIPDEDWESVENTDGSVTYHIPVTAGKSSEIICIDGRYDIILPLKVFQYGFSLSEMRCDKPDYLWYSDLGESLYVTIPGATEVSAYWGKEAEDQFHGTLLENDTFRIDISEIKRRIYSEERRHWQYVNLFYIDNIKRRLSLPAVLRSVDVRPYFKLGHAEKTPYIDINNIYGSAKVFLNIKEKSSGQFVVSDREISVGRTELPELSKGVLYDLFPYSQETDEFGFFTETVNLKPLLGVSFEDWHNLTECRLPVESILFEEEELARCHDYFVTLNEKLSEERYIGTMFSRKLAAAGKERYERDARGKFVQKRYGKVLVDMDIQGDELLMSLKMYSVVDGDWMAPFYDVQQKTILHCDDPRLRQKDPTGVRFLLLDEYETVLKINTDRISRVSCTTSTTF